MISFTDQQLAALRAAAKPLSPWDRSRFLQIVADRLMGKDLGDGAVYRVIRETQREFLTRSVKW
jgi:hypothetical protein